MQIKLKISFHHHCIQNNIHHHCNYSTRQKKMSLNIRPLFGYPFQGMLYIATKRVSSFNFHKYEKKQNKTHQQQKQADVCWTSIIHFRFSFFFHLEQNISTIIIVVIEIMIVVVIKIMILYMIHQHLSDLAWIFDFHFHFFLFRFMNSIFAYKYSSYRVVMVNLWWWWWWWIPVIIINIHHNVWKHFHQQKIHTQAHK